MQARNYKIAESLDSTVEAMRLLRQIREDILSAIRAWKSFVETDVPFFADLQDRSTMVAMDDMKCSFDKMVVLAQKLDDLQQFFADNAKIVSGIIGVCEQI
jgi:hypothetical protein